ncbi:RagB/SusD family nutrient uptake outer membrane protein [Sunxiuqinia sp. A32]|uniref:RagB/SusD family nutrient uptake outer membrane protein n=1 Tax=Sunxiuqinia sp. A32 TaxID=3461496 RepID=UPI004045B70D
MNRIYILIIIAALGIVSCAKLDTEPSDFVAPEYSYNTEDEINAALVGVYDALGERFLYSGINKALNVNFNCTDEMFLSSSKATNAVDIYSYSSTDASPNSIWGALYKGIERANIVLDNIEKPEMDEAKRNVVKGEAKFLRAYFHFVLVQNFGAVPLRTEPTASVKDIYNERVPADSVYNFIYNEMVEAEQLVNPITEYDYAERVTKSAVQGILARVCLFMAGFPNNMTEKYQDALYWAEKVINSGLHELNPDYSKVFINLSQDLYDTKESIMEIGYYTTGAGEIYSERGYLGTTMGIRQNLVSYGKASPRFLIQDMLFKKFDVQDLRRDWCIAPYSYKGNKAPTRVYWNDSQIYNRYIGKYRREYETLSNKSNYNSTNFQLLRYSDVLLMAAEAENEINGPTQKAIDYVNQVRRRAYGSGKSLKSISVTNPGTGYDAGSTTVTVVGGTAVAGLDPVSVIPVVEDGAITAINISNYGTMYNGEPTISIESSAGGIGAEAVAVLTEPEYADIKLVDFTSAGELREFLQDERARELCFEGWRRLDLMRWGILVSKMQEVAAYITETAPSNFKYAAAAGNNIEDKHNYLPIPNWETSTNHLTYQNPGW